MRMINERLETYIFDTLGAYYAPDYNDAKYNLENCEEKNRRYLGTYFPRTFVESYHIYRQLFDNVTIQDYFNGKADISILVIGSGTGGDLIGLLQVLNECFTGKNIVIYSFDGNQNALEIQKGLIRNFYQFMTLNNNRITVYTYQVKFTCADDIILSLENYRIPLVDIIQSFKMCNEIYNHSSDKNVFYQLIGLAERYLFPNGIFVLEDVTSKNEDGQYNSVVMSNQIRRYFRETPQSMLKYIVPTVCGEWYNQCTQAECLSIVEYRVSHRWVVNEISKVTYRIIMKQPLGQLIYETITKGEYYKLAPKTYCSGENYLYNQEIPPSNNIKDPYRIG